MMPEPLSNYLNGNYLAITQPGFKTTGAYGVREKLFEQIIDQTIDIDDKLFFRHGCHRIFANLQILRFWCSHAPSKVNKVGLRVIK